MDELIGQIVSSLQTRSTLPKFPSSLAVAEAYEIQHQVVASLGGDSIIGLKAGLTSKASQKSFGIPHPILGRLFESGRLLSGCTLPTTDGRFLECEIGICIDANGRPSSVCPIIELPRLAFARPTDATGTNLIACNVAADSFVQGDCTQFPTSFADCFVELQRDGEILYRASLTEPLGGPSESLNWMIKESHARGLSLPDEAVMLTGACGGIHPASPGRYVADYESLGSVEFEIVAA